MTLYTIEEAAELVGIKYNRLWYALVTGKLRERQRVGRIRLFDDYDIVEMRRHFGVSRDESKQKKA